MKKHKEIEQHNSQLERLRAKLHNLSLLDSSQLLNEKEMQESVRYLSRLLQVGEATDQRLVEMRVDLHKEERRTSCSSRPTSKKLGS